MKYKILTVITSIIILTSIIYFEQTNTPYNNIDAITNNSISTEVIDLGSSLEKKIKAHKHSNQDKQPTKNSTTKDKKNQSKQTAHTNNTITLPNFPITVIGNKDIKQIYDIKARKIIIHFWASWCNICKSEFNDLINYTKNNPSTAVVAISVDDDREELGKYLDSLDINNKLKTIKNLYFSWDHDKSISLDLFGTEMLPENYIISHHDNAYEVEEKTIGKYNWS